MRILLLEPYYSGSHKAWVDGLRKHSQHEIQLLCLPGRHWKWRMHGAALTFARQFLQLRESFDWILASSLMDLSTFTALTRKQLKKTRIGLYFHENQLTYPLSPQDQDPKYHRDQHYGFINLASALAADQVWFNSEYHRQVFLAAAQELLAQMRDWREFESLELLEQKCQRLPLGVDLSFFDHHQTPKDSQHAHIVWNHRWQHDKDPQTFFQLLRELKRLGKKFKLHLMGERFRSVPEVFLEARQELSDEIITPEPLPQRTDYARRLWQGHIALGTAKHDFFGTSVVEATYCQNYPILPYALAYPEHFTQQKHFYHSPQQALELLVWAVDNFRNLPSLAEHVSHYDWPQMISRYDDAFIQCYH